MKGKVLWYNSLANLGIVKTDKLFWVFKQSVDVKRDDEVEIVPILSANYARAKIEKIKGREELAPAPFQV